jgi:hypothetical protein
VEFGGIVQGQEIIAVTDWRGHRHVVRPPALARAVAAVGSKGGKRQ